jgi:monoamine oxidase
MQVSDAILERLAREILMVDERGNSLTMQYAGILVAGLPKSPHGLSDQRDVIVLGAGMAGLLTGKLLKEAGYDVTIVEANDSRVGGRIKTFRTEPGGPPAFKDPKQYAEAGAMRIPKSHVLVNALIDLLGLDAKRQVFYNTSKGKPGVPDADTYGTWLKANSILVRRDLYDSRDPSLSPQERVLGFPIPSTYRNSTAAELLSLALVKPNALIDPKTKTIDQQIAGWKQIIASYDEYSMRRYLLEHYQNETIVEYVGTLQNLTSRLFLSFFHSYVDTFYIASGESYYELAGGNWQLPAALAAYVDSELVMNARAVEIQWSDPATGAQGLKAIHRGRPGVYVRAINEPMTKRGMARADYGRIEREFTADYLVTTVPFSAMRFVSVTPDFSYNKRRAIIELHYDSATKVLLEFSERFWEWDPVTWRDRLGSPYRGHNALGGESITDAPSRFIYYPSHPPDPASRGGVVLASYTWSDEANRWDSTPDEERCGFALKGLTEIYGPEITKFYTGVGKTQSWMRDFYAYGEAAVFSPGQLTALHPYIPTPEGLVHFAGEHTSLKHAWIEGAIESAVRAALEIHARAARP